MKNLRKMLVFFQIALEIDFQWILERFWCQVGSQNGARIDIKGGWKNDGKMMMTRMAKKSDICGSGTIRHHRFGARGGVPPYCTGHTPTPSKTKYLEARLAIEQSFKVESSKIARICVSSRRTSCC